MFEIEIVETLSRTIIVLADSEELAIQLLDLAKVAIKTCKLRDEKRNLRTTLIVYSIKQI